MRIIWLTLCLAACASADEDVVEGTTQDLSATPIIDSSCSPAEASKLSGAVSLAGSFLADNGPAGAKAVLADQWYEGPRRAPETIVAARSTRSRPAS